MPSAHSLRARGAILTAAILALTATAPRVARAGIAGIAAPGATAYPAAGLSFTADVQVPPGVAPAGSNKGLYSAAIDTSTGYALFGSSAGAMTKVQLGVGGATPTVIGITSSANDGFASFGGLTNMFEYTTGPNLADHYAFVGGSNTSGSTTTLMKVQLFPNNNLNAAPKVVSTITLPIASTITSSAVDYAHGLAYFTTFNSGTLVQLNLNTNAITSVTGLPATLNYWQMGLANNQLYISDSTQITRVKLGANGALPASLNAGNLDSIAAPGTATFYLDPDPAHPYAYTGGFTLDPTHTSTTVPSTFTRFNIGGPTLTAGPTTSIQVPGASFYTSLGALDPDSHYLLMSTDNALPGSVSKLNVLNPAGVSLAGSILLPLHNATQPWPYSDGDLNVRSVILDPTTGYAYLGEDSGISNTLGTRIAKVQYSQKGSIKGDKITLPAGAALTSVNFFSHISSPATASSSGNVRLALYTDAAGVPGNLLWQSDNIANAVAAAGDWLTVTSGLPTIAAAGTYWLAWQLDSTLDVPGYALGDPNSGFTVDQPFGTFPAAMPIAPPAGSNNGLSLTSDNWSMNVTFNTPVPEPSSLALIALASLPLLLRGRHPR